MPQKKKGVVKSDENVTPGEDLQISGIFQADFPIHCKSNGVPVIGVKVMEGTTETATDLPFWVSIKNDVSDDPNFKKLDQLAIRGWQVTPPVIASLQLSLKSHLVTTISLWETGLSSTALLKSFLDILPVLQCRYLELGGSPINDIQPVCDLISSCTSLIGLKIRCSEITDPLITTLSSVLKTNPPLQQLDLSCNKIGDEGVKALSKALRVNNNLMVLSLANNLIGDVGAVYLFEALKEFRFEHEEIVQRRRLSSQCLQQQWDALKKSSTASRRSSSLDHRSSSRDKLSESKKSSTGSMLKAASFISKMKKGAESAKAKAAKGKKGLKDEPGTVTPRDSPSRPPARSASSTIPVATGPLVDNVRETENGIIVSSGNFSLISLSLSCNKIGSSALEPILKTLEYQSQQLKQTEQQEKDLLVDRQPPPPGLMALFLSRNLFQNENETYVKICDVLKHRDPCQPLQTNTPADNETINTESTS